MGPTVHFAARLIVLVSCLLCAAPGQEKPNLVVIFCDDLGYADLGCFGHPTIRTPELDRMAREGTRFTQFYTAASVCTPSRAGLLTGRLPIRNGMCSARRRVLFPDSKGGLPATEVTIAEVLKAAGYATGCFGKWHLGHLPRFLPTRHGFDTYFGIPYSNDMDRVGTAPKGRKAFDQPRVEYWNTPLLRDEKIIERPADQRTITRRYTDEAIAFMKKNADRPFFVYLPHSMPHVPLFASDAHIGKSPRGLYGDVIEEIDANVGRVLEHLRTSGLAERTLVIFTSDNGPWLSFGTHGGSAGLLRHGKGTTFEGGMRVPMLAWWPGKVPAARTSTDLMTTLDILPTACALAGTKAPSDRPLDGVDVSKTLLGTAESPRKTVLYYRGVSVYAIRHERWKLHFFTQGAYGQGLRKRTPAVPALLYDLHVDPSEKHDVAKHHPEIVAKLTALANEHRRGVDAPPSQLELR